jgi:hypothetical protein
MTQCNGRKMMPPWHAAIANGRVVRAAGPDPSRPAFLLPEPRIWFALKRVRHFSAAPKMAKTLFVETL